MDTEKRDQAYKFFSENFKIKTTKIKFKVEEIEKHLDADMVEAYRNLVRDELECDPSFKVEPYLEKNEYIILDKNDQVVKKVHTMLDITHFILCEAKNYIEEKERIDKMAITEQQLRTFNENFKICLAQTKTTFYSMNEYLELDDFESPDESISQDDYRKQKLNNLYIDDYQPTSSDIDHEIYSIETKHGQHVISVENMGDVSNFIKNYMNSTLRNENYFPKETEIHINQTNSRPKTPRTNKSHQPVTHI